MDIVLHIGNHKTGSKTLQKHFFLNLKFRKFLGDPYKPGSEIEELFERIKYQDFLSFDSQRAKELFNRLKNSERLDKENNPILISDESLTTPTLGGRMTADPGLIANRIKDLFGDVKILYVIRSQYTMLPSMYSQFVSPEIISQQDFEETIKIHLKNQLNGIMHGLRYDKICSHYKELFGMKNIKVIPYELLVNDPRSYYKEISEFIDEPLDNELIDRFINIRENKRLNKSEIMWRKFSLKYERFRKKNNLKRLSEYTPYFKGNRIELIFKKMFFNKKNNLKIPDEFEKIIHEFFGYSNYRLQEMFGLDLSKYDYPLMNSNIEPDDNIGKFELGGWSVRRY